MGEQPNVDDKGRRIEEKAPPNPDPRRVEPPSPRDSQDWVLRHKHLRRTLSVVGVYLAGGVVLALQTRLVCCSTVPEPTKTISIPVREGARPATVLSKTADAGQMSAASPEHMKTPAVSSRDGDEPAQYREVMVSSSWVQLAHLAVVLSSCVCVLMAVIWAIVSLNREEL